MLVRLAWRNLGRNRRRTSIAVAALALGTTALIVTHSFAETSYAAMIDLATRGLLGHVQVHVAGYQAEPAIGSLVKDRATVCALIDRTVPQGTVLSRVAGAGLAASESRSVGVVIIGVEPAPEAEHSDMLQIALGRTLSSAPAREVVVGTRLARRLKVQPGAELVLLSEGADGSIANDVYTVVGLSTGGGTTETGGNAVFLHLGDAQEFFALGEGVHQLVVQLPPGADARAAAHRVRSALPAGHEALAWQEMAPDAERGIEADRRGTFAMDLIVFLLVVLGMFNAMTMATFERTFELGVMTAIGTRPQRIFGIIIVESLLLGAFSFIAGAALAAAIIALLPPIDLSDAWGGADFAGVALPSVIHVRLAPLALAMGVVTATCTCVVGGLYPAWRAARMRPVDAMRGRT